MIARIACVVVSVGVLAPQAAAQPAGAQAEELFKEGKQLMAAKKYAEACAKFQSSQQLDPVVTTLVNEADCREKAGQLATAWGLFLEAERQTRPLEDKAGKKLHDVARARATKLEPRLSKLTIQVDHRVDGLEIHRDSEAVRSASWGSPLPVDGGTYKIEARATGFQPWSTTIEVKPERDAQTVSVAKLVPATAAEPVTTPVARAHEGAPAPAPASPDTPEPEVPSGSHSSHAALWVGGGALVLGIAAGAFELSGRSTLDDAKRQPDPAKQDSLYNSANTRHYIAQGLGVAALGCAGVAVYLFVRHRGDEAGKSTTAIVPAAGSDHVGFALVGAWR